MICGLFFVDSMSKYSINLKYLVSVSVSNFGFKKVLTKVKLSYVLKWEVLRIREVELGLLFGISIRCNELTSCERELIKRSADVINQ